MTSPLAPSASTHDRPTRPRLVTVLGWCFLVSAIMTFFSAAMAFSPGTPPEAWAVQGIDPQRLGLYNVAIGFATGLAGWGLLKRHAWSRPLYVGTTVVSLLVSAAFFDLSTAMLAFSGAFVGLFIFLLYRPDVTAYLDGTYRLSDTAWSRRRTLQRVRTEPRNPNDLMRVFGVLVAIGAGFCVLMVAFMLSFDQRQVGIGMALVFAIPAMVSLALAVWLWGAGRWRAVSGWTLTAAGGWAVLSGLYLLMLARTPEWQQLMDANEAPPFTPSMWLGLTLVGAMIGVIGSALLHWQYQLDHDAADALLAGAPN